MRFESAPIDVSEGFIVGFPGSRKVLSFYVKRAFLFLFFVSLLLINLVLSVGSFVSLFVCLFLNDGLYHSSLSTSISATGGIAVLCL